MKRFSTLFLLCLLALSCKEQEELTIETLTERFYTSVDQIDKLQYDVQNITHYSSGTVWDNKGFAIIERNASDNIFGFDFYGVRHDVNGATIYKNGLGFDVSYEDQSFEQEPGSVYVLGNAGGQMVYEDFFKLDSVYKTISIDETDTRYVLNYTFEDDVENKITDKTKTVELRKTDLLPLRVSSSLQPDFGKKQSIEFLFENIKINEAVENSIKTYMEDLNTYKQIIESDEIFPSPLLEKPLPELVLKDLFDDSKELSIKTNKLTLIDFWEVWCGYCIKAFPDVEHLKTTYEDDLNVVGIVAQDLETARELVKHKETTLVNLIGTKELQSLFNVNSWPRYFLVDKTGVIQKEYYGFSDKIEKDIQSLIGE